MEKKTEKNVDFFFFSKSEYIFFISKIIIIITLIYFKTQTLPKQGQLATIEEGLHNNK